MYKNSEGYPDQTAGRAIREADKPPREVLEVIYALKNIASLAGFEIKGRIHLVDKVTKKEWTRFIIWEARA